MRLLPVAAILAVLLSGCGGGHRPAVPPPIRTLEVACAQPPSLARPPLPGETGIYRAGPLLLAIGDDMAQIPLPRTGQPIGGEAIAVLSGPGPVVLSVGPRSGTTLQFAAPIYGDENQSAERFPDCGEAGRRFGGGITFAGPGCARLTVTPARGPALPLIIPVGNTLRGCPSLAHAVRLPASALPFLGLACHPANTFGCRRVGIGVHLRRAATLVMVRLAGRLVTLDPPGDPAGDLWQGYLYAADFRHGSLALHVSPRTSSWFGQTDVNAPVSVVAFLPNGHTATLAAADDPLHAGFG